MKWRADGIRPYGTAESPKARRRAASISIFPYGRRGEAELRREFFAPLSFKKAGAVFLAFSSTEGYNDNNTGGVLSPPFLEGGLLCDESEDQHDHAL